MQAQGDVRILSGIGGRFVDLHLVEELGDDAAAVAPGAVGHEAAVLAREVDAGRLV